MSKNQNWNGSTLTFGGAGITPLTSLNAPNEPEKSDTTGSTDAAHTAIAGLPKVTLSANFLGSRCPAPGTIATIDASLGAPAIAGGDPHTETYAIAVLTQVNVSGRKNGTIEGSLTAVPGASTLTAAAQTWPVGELAFNGSSFTFGGLTFTDLQSANYSGTCQPVPCAGADGTEEVYAPGIPQETLTIVCLGNPQAVAKSIGATAMDWHDGGSLGSWPYAKLMSTRPGGSIDGQETTEYVLERCRSNTTVNN